MAACTELGEVGHVAHMGETRNAHRVLVWEDEQKRPFGTPRHECRCNNIETSWN
jgi:hypothetical protein